VARHGFGPPAAGFGVDMPAAGGRDCGACGGRQLIAEPLGSRIRRFDVKTLKRYLFE